MRAARRCATRRRAPASPATRARRSTCRSTAPAGARGRCTSGSAPPTTSRRRTACCSCSSGGPGQPGLSDPRPVRRQGARCREGDVPDRRLRPARDRRRRARLRGDAAADGLRRISIRRPPRPCGRARRRSATAGSSTGRTTSSPTSTPCAGRSASTRSRSTESRTARTSASGTRSRIPDHVSKLVLDSVVPHVGLSDLGVVEFRGDGARPPQRVRQRCVDDLAAVVKRYHDGVDVLDALTTDSIVDPTYKTVFDIPQALRAARNGAPGLLESFIVEHARRRRRRLPTRSTRGCTRARSAPTGAIRGAPRRRRSPAARPR